MQSPARTPVSVETVRAIIDRHRLCARTFSMEPRVGAGGCVYQLGDDLVLKVPHDGSAWIESARIEAVAVTAVHAANVRTARLVAFDDSLELLPVPYLVYERVHGEALDRLDLPPPTVRQVWREVGRDLALAHTRVHASEPLHILPTHEHSPDVDPRLWVDEEHRGGCLTAAQARWLRDVLDHSAPAVFARQRMCFCHGDVNAANVMVGHDEPRPYVALLDWGGAAWGDPAVDFRSMPLAAVPYTLAGHRDVAPLEDDDTAEARILWFYIQLALFHLNRKPPPESERAHRIERLLRDTRQFVHWARLA